jgi:hypothetical protein
LVKGNTAIDGLSGREEPELLTGIIDEAPAVAVAEISCSLASAERVRISPVNW